jgi:hypothetical protein
MTEGAAGNAWKWKDDLLPEEFIPDILELVLKSWDNFEKPDRLENEVSISKNFYRDLKVEKNKKGDLPFHIWCEVTTFNEVTDEGRVDILFAYLGSINEEVHFAFECKRLRIPYPPPSKFLTNNSEYVGDQGMLCFITGKYSGRVKHGGMIGYVMDGDVQKAISSLADLIKQKAVSLQIENNTGLEPSSFLTASDNLKETKHILTKKNFTIHHVFLSV